MAGKKKVHYIDLTKEEDGKCQDDKIEFKEFQWCTCMESISISVRDVNKQPADSSNLPMDSSNGKDASSYAMLSSKYGISRDNVDGSGDCAQGNVIDVKPK